MGLLGQTMMWAVGNILQRQGVGPGSARESSGLLLWHIAGAQTCVSMDKWRKAVWGGRSG